MMLWNRYKHLKVSEILRQLAIENDVPNASTLKLRELIKQANQYFFEFDYPMIEFNDVGQDGFYPSIVNKEDFQEKFLMHFINEKVCVEDLDLFFVYLEETLNLIMPYYINLLKSEEWFKLYITNPADNTSYKETYTREIEGQNTSDSTTDSTSTTNDTTDYSSTVDNTVDSTVTTNQTQSTDSTQTQSSTSTTTQNVKNVQNDTPINMLDDTDYASSVGTNNSSVTQESTGNGENNSTATVNGTNKTVENNGTTQTDKTTVAANGTNKTTGNTTASNTQTETYTFNRTGNIGVQTPGEVFAHTRQAFINTLKLIYEDESIKQLFDGYDGGVY